MLKNALATLQDLFGKRKQFKDNSLFNLLVPNEVKLYIFSFLTGLLSLFMCVLWLCNVVWCAGLSFTCCMCIVCLVCLAPSSACALVSNIYKARELCTLALVCRDTKILAMDDSLWMKFFMKIDYIVENNFPPSARVCHSAVVCIR